MTVLDRGTAGGSVRYEDDADLVLAARAGDPDAFGTLFDRWFDRVHDVAFRILRDRGLAAEVAQDVFLVGWTHLNGIEQPASFGGWLLRTARNRALNRLDREQRSVAVSDEETVMHSPRDQPESDPGDALHRAEQVDLVWAAAAALGDRDASVLDLHLRHGMGAAELAEVLEVTANNAHQLLFRMKQRLAAAVKGWVLWRGGRPACAELAELLELAGITSFGPAAVAVIGRHADRCTACESRRDQRLAPEAMYAAVPLAAAAPLMKAEAAGALEAAGVPMKGSKSLGTTDPGSGPGAGGAPGSGSGSGLAIGAGVPMAESADAAVPTGSAAGHRNRGRRRRIQMLATVALLVIVAATMVLADSLDEVETLGAPPATGSTAPLPTTEGTAITTTTPQTTTTDATPSTTTSAIVSTTVPPFTAVPSSTAPVPPPPPPPPTTDGTTTTVTTEPAPADPPVINGFRVVALDDSCFVNNDMAHTATWSSADATSATLGPVGGPASDVPTSGTANVCAPSGSSFVLALTGPGGEVSEVTTAVA